MKVSLRMALWCGGTNEDGTKELLTEGQIVGLVVVPVGEGEGCTGGTGGRVLRIDKCLEDDDEDCFADELDFLLFDLLRPSSFPFPLPFPFPFVLFLCVLTNMFCGRVAATPFSRRIAAVVESKRTHGRIGLISLYCSSMKK